jgi:hypothetical protein
MRKSCPTVQNDYFFLIAHPSSMGVATKLASITVAALHLPPRMATAAAHRNTVTPVPPQPPSFLQHQYGFQHQKLKKTLTEVHGGFKCGFFPMEEEPPQACSF